MPKKDEDLQKENTQDIAETSPETQIEVENDIANITDATAIPETEASENIESEPEIKLDNFDNIEIGPSTQTEDEAETDSETPITVQPVRFGSFEDLSQSQGEVNKNLDILMDIKLQLTVELGRTELPIRKVLELTRGSIIELEKIAGEPVELYANGKLVAHGEVVVIEDNFGLRITSITDPEDRLKGLGN